MIGAGLIVVGYLTVVLTFGLPGLVVAVVHLGILALGMKR